VPVWVLRSRVLTSISRTVESAVILAAFLVCESALSRLVRITLPSQDPAVESVLHTADVGSAIGVLGLLIVHFIGFFIRYSIQEFHLTEDSEK